MEQKPAKEFVDCQAHHAFLVLMSGVPPSKRDLAVAEGDQSAVGDGDAVSVGAEISDDVLWAAERTLAIDHPVIPEELPDP